MRNTTKLAALFAGLAAAVVGVAPAAAAAQDHQDHQDHHGTPVCLIANTHHDHFFGKQMTCVRLDATPFGVIGEGRLTPGDHDQHTITTTVQELRPWQGHLGWQTVATASRNGTGVLVAVTHPVRVPIVVRVRACADVDNSQHPLCTP